MNPRQATKSKALALYKPDYTQNVRVSARGNDLEHVLIGVMSRESRLLSKWRDPSCTQTNVHSTERQGYTNTATRVLDASFFIFFFIR